MCHPIRTRAISYLLTSKRHPRVIDVIDVIDSTAVLFYQLQTIFCDVFVHPWVTSPFQRRGPDPVGEYSTTSARSPALGENAQASEGPPDWDIPGTSGDYCGRGWIWYWIWLDVGSASRLQSLQGFFLCNGSSLAIPKWRIFSHPLSQKLRFPASHGGCTTRTQSRKPSGSRNPSP